MEREIKDTVTKVASVSPQKSHIAIVSVYAKVETLKSSEMEMRHAMAHL